MDCVCRVSLLKTKDHRIECRRSGSLYNVSGALAGMDVVLCSRHVATLQRLGLTVDKCIPLEQATARAEHQRRKGLRTIAKPGEPGGPALDSHGAA